MIAPEEVYPTGSTDIWILFDFRDGNALKSLHLQRGALQEFGDLAFIDEDHVLLIVGPGGARRVNV